MPKSKKAAGFAFCSTSRKHKQAYGCNTLQLDVLQQASTKASREKKKNGLDTKAVCIKKGRTYYDNAHA